MYPLNTPNTFLNIINSSKNGRECPRSMKILWRHKNMVGWTQPRLPIKLLLLQLQPPRLPLGSIPPRLQQPRPW